MECHQRKGHSANQIKPKKKTVVWVSRFNRTLGLEKTLEWKSNEKPDGFLTKRTNDRRPG